MRPEGRSRLVEPARIRYRDDQPFSLEFDDIYHAADGAAEVARVFVEPTGLPALAAARARRGGPDATVRIGELGFGSGLNFVVAAATCLKAGARLHFVSCEARPLGAGDFAAIAARRQAAHPLYQALAAVYPPAVAGWHQRVLAGGRLRLTVWFGDAADALADLTGRQRRGFDAWFLDGFAPDRNPELWEPALFQAIAALSAPEARVATFTSAGRVRRGLEAAGFAMRRVDQRPHKRESLAGTLSAPGRRAEPPPSRIHVAGAGLAGASVARHLADAGCAVTVSDPRFDPAGAADPALPASTMPATVLHARLLTDGTPTEALRCHAYLYAAARTREWAGVNGTGTLQAAADERDAGRLQRVAAAFGPSGGWLRWLPAAEASALAGWPLPWGALHFPGAARVSLPTLVRSLLDHPGIELTPTPTPADRPLVLACGAAVRAFEPAAYLEVVPVQGQIDLVTVAAMPRLPLVGARYLIPTDQGLAAGSTYEHRPWAPDRATAANLEQLVGSGCSPVARWRGTRSVSSDRTAIAGPLYRADGAVEAGLWVSTGHGSAGNVSTHLAAALITAELLGDAPPLARDAAAALSPWRFRERQARRGPRHGAEDSLG